MNKINILLKGQYMKRYQSEQKAKKSEEMH